MSAPALRLRHVRAPDGDRLRAIRLRSLRADPDAFGSTYARDAALPDDEWARRAVASEAGDTQRTFVVCDDADEWLGLALARQDEQHPGEGVVNAMWVDPRARGQGAAGRLCDACADWAAARGLRALVLDVVVDNAPARRAYERAGFVVRGETLWEDEGRTLHELVMARELSSPADGGPRSQRPASTLSRRGQRPAPRDR